MSGCELCDPVDESNAFDEQAQRVNGGDAVPTLLSLER